MRLQAFGTGRWAGCVAVLLAVVVALGSVAFPATASAATATPTIEELRQTKEGAYVSTVATPQDSPLINKDYDRQYDTYTVTSADGFLHPGVIINREQLNIMRDMVWIGADPWKTSFEQLQKSMYSSLDYTMSGPFETISSDRETYAMLRTATACYSDALMWYVTGNQAYADKAIDMMMQWADTVKEDKKLDHIRAGSTMQQFAIAAEIFRYTPSSGWTDDNTARLEKLFEVEQPAVDKPYEYFNQGVYALMGYTAKSIFEDDAASYAKAVERFAYNKEGGIKSGNSVNGKTNISVNYSLASIVLNSGQIVEMGRDQDHAWDDTMLLSDLAQAIYTQGTKIAPDGTIDAANGVDPYEFDNQKLLKACAFWQKYNLGEDITWAGTNGLGTEAPWDKPSGGLMSVNWWQPATYYHYRYTKGYTADMARDTTAPRPDVDASVDEFKTYGDAYAYLTRAADVNADTPMRTSATAIVDFPSSQDLVFTPLAAIYDTPLAGAPTAGVAAQDNFAAYGRVGSDRYTGTGNGPVDPTHASSQNDRRNGGVITEPGVDEEGASHWIISDLNNGEWVSYTVDFDALGGSVDELTMTYGTKAGNEPKVDVYVADETDHPTDADATAAMVDANKAGTLTLGPTGGYAVYKTYSGTMDNPSLLKGKKTVYFYCYGSNNVYSFFGNILWFKFSGPRAGEANAFSSANLASGAQVSETGAVVNAGGYVGWKAMDFDSGIKQLAVSGYATGDGTLRVLVGDVAADTEGSGVAKVAAVDADGTGGAAGTVLGEIAVKAGAFSSAIDLTNAKAALGLRNVYFVWDGEGQVLLTSASSEAELAPTPEPTLPTVGLSVSELSLVTGATAKFEATASEGADVTWASSDDAVATVDEDGTVTAVAAGSATVTVTATDPATGLAATASCDVTVTAPDGGNGGNGGDQGGNGGNAGTDQGGNTGNQGDNGGNAGNQGGQPGQGGNGGAQGNGGQGGNAGATKPGATNGKGGAKGSGTGKALPQTSDDLPAGAVLLGAALVAGGLVTAGIRLRRSSR